MANPNDIARQDTRELLVSLRDALGQPPLSVKLRLCMEGVMDLLGEQDLGKRMAMREQIHAYLVETWGE